MKEIDRPNLEAPSQAEQRANVVYYFHIGAGNWVGTFRFTITNWKSFWSDRIDLKNRFLALGMFILMKLFSIAKITSRIESFPYRGEAGIATNLVQITKGGITLYLLKEQYVLSPNGRDVWVLSKERFGPVPFLLNGEKEHPAEILDAGMRSVYYIPLLGTEWTGRYVVQKDRNHIESHITCPWGEAQEIIQWIV